MRFYKVYGRDAQNCVHSVTSKSQFIYSCNATFYVLFGAWHWAEKKITQKQQQEKQEEEQQ